MEGQDGACTMTSTSMMVIVGLLERILASKAALERKARECKEPILKVISIMYFMVQHVNILRSIQKAKENHMAGEVIHQAALKGMCAQWPDDEIVPDSEEEQINASRKLKQHHEENDGEVDHNNKGQASPHHGPKDRCHSHNKHYKKYKAIFQLLERAGEGNKGMEMRAEESQREAFEQVTRALESYNRLLKQILHAIVIAVFRSAGAVDFSAIFSITLLIFCIRLVCSPTNEKLDGSTQFLRYCACLKPYICPTL